MDDIQKNSFEAFDEMLKSIDKKELNNLIEEISNAEYVGEPSIVEYFSLIEGQFAHFYFSEEMADDSSKNIMHHFQSFENILNATYSKIPVSESITRSFNVLLNHQDANGLFDASSKSEKSMKKTTLAA